MGLVHVARTSVPTTFGFVISFWTIRYPITHLCNQHAHADVGGSESATWVRVWTVDIRYMRSIGSNQQRINVTNNLINN